MASAWMVGAAEEELSRTVTVAFFLPAIVYMADAVGTQTEVLAVRGLAVGVEVRDIVVKELVTGFLIGLCISSAFLPFVLVLYGTPGQFDRRERGCPCVAVDPQCRRQGPCFRVGADLDGDSGLAVDCHLSRSRNSHRVSGN